MNGPVPATSEEVVLLDEQGRAVGRAAKASVHHQETPLHLAFSCYVFDAADRLLITQRALAKATFPGVWSNSFCGHPAPGEDYVAAVRRRGEQELGLGLADLTLTLPRFRYVAQMANGVRENEMCPVFTARVADPRAQVRVEPSEVDEAVWVDWVGFRDDVLSGRREVSSWCVEQVAQLAARESSDAHFTPGDPAQLPPAAR